MTTNLSYRDTPSRYCTEDAALKGSTAIEPTLTYAISAQDKQIAELADAVAALISHLGPVLRLPEPRDDGKEGPVEDLPAFVGAIAQHNKRLGFVKSEIIDAINRLAI
jgi:hypothetical protein